jgi:hypothetical protein
LIIGAMPAHLSFFSRDRRIVDPHALRSGGDQRPVSPPHLAIDVVQNVRAELQAVDHKSRHPRAVRPQSDEVI